MPTPRSPSLPAPSFPARAAVLSELLRDEQLWRAGTLAGGAQAPGGVPREPTGFPELDAALGGGWPRAGLTELLHDVRGIGELRLLLPALARLSRERAGWIAWIAPPHLPCADALAAAGVDLDRVLLVHARGHRAILWALEQALKSGTCSAVLGWPDEERLRPADLRRLQVAARTSGTWGVLCRDRAAAHETSVAALRLALDPRSGERLHLSVLKCQGTAARPELLLDLPPVLARQVPGASLQRLRASPEPEARPRAERLPRRPRTPAPPPAPASPADVPEQRSLFLDTAGAEHRTPEHRTRAGVIARAGGYGSRPSA